MRAKTQRPSLDTAGAVQSALAGLLARRDYATAEARERLIERGAAPELAAASIADFTAKGYLNDARFAEKYVNYAAQKGLGPRRIVQELRERGLANELIESALLQGPDWRSLCENLRRRRFGAVPPRTWADKARQARFLQYRGFSSDHMRLPTDFDPSENPEE